MQIRPVTQIAPSPIPTAAQAAADPSLIAPAPSARPRRALGAVVGAGLLGSLLAPVAAAAQKTDAPAVPAPATPAVPDPAEAEAAARAEAARQAVATVVAPILQKALDEEGRGWFACVAIDPPALLSEAEALDLIEREFAEAGVKLVRDREISGFTRTVPDPDGEVRQDQNGCRLYPAKQIQGTWTFDLVSEDGSLAVEFLDLEDEIRESFEENRAKTAESFDLVELALRLRDDFSTRTNGAPLSVGIFFDPLPTDTVWDAEQEKHVPRPGTSFAILPDIAREALEHEHGKRHEMLHNDARELLREQVRHFLDWARAEGCLP